MSRDGERQDRQATYRHLHLQGCSGGMSPAKVAGSSASWVNVKPFSVAGASVSALANVLSVVSRNDAACAFTVTVNMRVVVAPCGSATSNAIVEVPVRASSGVSVIVRFVSLP